MVNQCLNPRRLTPAQTWWIRAGQQCTPSQWATPPKNVPTELEAVRKDYGVLAARLPGKSWAPSPVDRCKANMGTILAPPHQPDRGKGGQAHRQPVGPGWGGAAVVVRGRESRSHGEGRQRVRSGTTGMPGGRG
jgi:hypothetical protein